MGFIELCLAWVSGLDVNKTCFCAEKHGPSVSREMSLGFVFWLQGIFRNTVLPSGSWNRIPFNSRVHFCPYSSKMDIIQQRSFSFCFQITEIPLDMLLNHTVPSLWGAQNAWQTHLLEPFCLYWRRHGVKRAGRLALLWGTRGGCCSAGCCALGLPSCSLVCLEGISFYLMHQMVLYNAIAWGSCKWYFACISCRWNHWFFCYNRERIWGGSWK